MCSPKEIIDLPEDALMSQLTACLADLQRRHRPTPASGHVQAAIRTTFAQLTELERALSQLPLAFASENNATRRA